MIGYKAFNYDMTCRNFQYEIGQKYEINEEPKVCFQGFHFCENLEDVFNYYPFSKKTKVCKVKALGKINTRDYIKFCTNNIKIEEEINFDYLFQLRYKKEVMSDSIDLSSVEIGTKIPMGNNHTLICVSIQDNKYIFAFDEIRTVLSFFKIHSFIYNLDNFKGWLSQEWLDNISEIFIPNEYEIYGSYFWSISEDEYFLPFIYYKYKQNRMKYMDGDLVPWWLSGRLPDMVDSFYFSYFANVSGYGDAIYSDALFALGIVPHFVIKR